MQSLNGRKRKAELQGVGGLLLLLCVFLTIIAPAVSVFLYSAELSRVLENWDGFQTVATFHLIADVGALGVTAFSIYAGIALWAIRPDAVRKAKTYLIAAFAYNVIIGLACLSLGASPFWWAPAATVNSAVEGLTADTISFVIWFTYLRESKRVKATYALQNDVVANS